MRIKAETERNKDDQYIGKIKLVQTEKLLSANNLN